MRDPRTTTGCGWPERGVASGASQFLGLVHGGVGRHDQLVGFGAGIAVGDPVAAPGVPDHLAEHHRIGEGGVDGRAECVLAFPRGDGDELVDVLEAADLAEPGEPRGGIRDHLQGGFHRYSVDQRWFVPHFEKMLYDQALLALAYLEGHQASGDEGHAVVARELLDFAAALP